MGPQNCMNGGNYFENRCEAVDVAIVLRVHPLPHYSISRLIAGKAPGANAGQKGSVKRNVGILCI